MKLVDNIKELLQEYIKKNEVVYQVCNDLVEVSNEENKDNRQILLGYFDKTSSIEIYEKGASFIHEPFEELDNWATKDDVLFLLEIIGILICIPRNIALSAGLIVED